MSDDGGGSGGSVKAILMRKVGPFPLVVYGGMGVVALAWYLHKRNAANAAAAAADQPAATSSNIGASSLPDMFSMAYPMPYSNDVFVNIKNDLPLPAAPAPTPAPTPAPPPPPPPAVVLPPPPPKQTSITYVVKSGDTLWAIAAKFLGSGAAYPRIYAANAGLIEAIARQHGFASSSGGHWIFPGEQLVIPT